ncbi:MAG TPA: c-type cytochrome [Gemmatimonadaceae bacterium]|nr:c-type cytochrome [Gemmatimonadaceae bacterium]
MTRFRVLAFAALASIAIPVLSAGAQNQGPPPPPKNLKFFPKDISRQALLDTMGTFTRALGVGCAFCHMVDDSIPRERRDFSLDVKPNKDKARTMLRMVTAINADYLTKLSSRLEPPVVVTCATCHRGVTEPRPLEQVILTRYDSAGTDSAIALYRDLRQHYYGRASYDFGEAPLAAVGGALRQRDKVADALKFYMLNLEYAPNSASAWSQAGGAQLASGDTATAIKSFEKALSIDPKDRGATRAMQALKPKP